MFTGGDSENLRTPAKHVAVDGTPLSTRARRIAAMTQKHEPVRQTGQ